MPDKSIGDAHLGLRVPKDLLEQLKERARREDRSVSATVRTALREICDRERRRAEKSGATV